MLTGNIRNDESWLAVAVLAMALAGCVAPLAASDGDGTAPPAAGPTAALAAGVAGAGLEEDLLRVHFAEGGPAGLADRTTAT